MKNNNKKIQTRFLSIHRKLNSQVISVKWPKNLELTRSVKVYENNRIYLDDLNVDLILARAVNRSVESKTDDEDFSIDDEPKRKKIYI